MYLVDAARIFVVSVGHNNCLKLIVHISTRNTPHAICINCTSNLYWYIYIIQLIL